MAKSKMEQETPEIDKGIDKTYAFPVSMCPETLLFKDGSLMIFQVAGRRKGEKIEIHSAKRIG